MRQYHELAERVLRFGVVKQQRAVLASTGQRPRMRSLFGEQVRYDLRSGFPILTTKKIRFDWVVGELLWFLSGSSNVKDLHKYGITFWDEWADEHGDLGPVYGHVWQYWKYVEGDHLIKDVDQIQELIKNIQAVRDNPEHSAGRRLILTAWQPGDQGKYKAPLGCHTLSQFNVTEGRLSCQLYQRSADLFLGVPYNISTYALLTHLLAKVCRLEVGEFIHTFGDVHIYENHEEAVRKQLGRIPKPSPRLELDDITSIDDISPEQIRLIGYDYYPPIAGEVAI